MNTSEHQHYDQHHDQHQHHDVAGRHNADTGYTLIEMIFVVVILGIIAGAATFAVTGITAQAAETGCLADRRQLHVSAESFFAQRHTDLIPASGTDHDRFEQTLVDGGFMRAPSTFHDLDATGAVIPQENTSC